MNYKNSYITINGLLLFSKKWNGVRREEEEEEEEEEEWNGPTGKNGRKKLPEKETFILCT